MRRTARLALRIAALLASGLACGRGRHEALFRDAPVILISIDTLRADHLPAYGYKDVATPNLDALRRDAVLFTGAFAQSPLTLPSHICALTGELPPAHGVRDNVGYKFDAKAHATLARLAREKGFATGAAVSAFVLRGGTGLAPDFDFYDDAIEAPLQTAAISQAQRPGGETAARALGWLEKSAGKPVLLLPPSLRAAHALRAARALPDHVRGPPLRRGDRRRRRHRGPLPREAARSRDLRPRRTRPLLGPRRGPRRPRRGRARHPALPRDAARPAARQAAGQPPRGPDRRRSGEPRRPVAHDRGPGGLGGALESPRPQPSRGSAGVAPDLQRDLLSAHPSRAGAICGRSGTDSGTTSTAPGPSSSGATRIRRKRRTSSPRRRPRPGP